METLGLLLDLTFIHSPKPSFLGLIDPSTKLRLTEAEPWSDELKGWIQVIRNDMSLMCPDVVRRTFSISMGLKLTDDCTISELNAFWRKKTESTDVLSFPALDETIFIPEGQCVELGDIVVSVTTAYRQAREHNHELITELRWLVSHGLLHLLGWDHPDEKSLNEMLSLQQKLLSMQGNLQLPSV